MRPEFEDIPLNKTDERFEIVFNGHAAFVEYEERDGKLVLTHTEAPEELRGTGAAGALLEKIFMWMEENETEIIPLCPYIIATLKRKTEWQKIVAEPHRSRLSS